MQRLKQILEEIQLIEDLYKVNLSSDKNTRQQKSEHVYGILAEVLKSKKFFDEKDFDMIRSFNFSRFEELEILKQPYMELKEMREIADLFCCVIIPISYSGYKPKNKKNKKTADSLGMNTYVITSLKNYDVWKEVICSQEVGGKYFPEKYIQILLTIELLIGTQKNLYEMVKDNKNKINLLTKAFNENMQAVQKIFVQIGNNQERLKAQSDYLLEKVINERMREHQNIKEAILEKDREIRHQEFLEKLAAFRAQQRFRNIFDETTGEEISVQVAGLGDWAAPRELNYYEYKEYHEETKKALKEWRVAQQSSEKYFEEIKERFNLEDIEKFKFEFIKLKDELSFLTKTQKELEDDGAIIFHSFSVDPMNENCIVFLNE